VGMTCCAGGYVCNPNGSGCVPKTSNNTSNPSPSPSSTTPTIACSGLTTTPTPTTPAVGDKYTFTCAGAVTPADAGTIAYDFRYNLNSGAWKTLTNVTPTTAQLSIAACGTYSVQCRACATLSGTKQCSPVWQGATQ
jgi:hypothetical protein